MLAAWSGRVSWLAPVLWHHNPRLLISVMREGPEEAHLSEPSGVPPHGLSHWVGQVLSKKVTSLADGSELSQVLKERVLRG